MTDKVQKIREEVEGLRNLHQMKYQQLDTNDNMSLVECGKRNLCNELLSFIDSLQQNLSNVQRTGKNWKEPVSEDKMTISKEWFEHCKKSWYNEGYIDGKYNRDRQFKEPVSEELEDAASSFARKDSEGISNPANFYYTVADKARIFKAGANWKKTKLMANATEVTVHIDAGGYPYIPQMELYDYDKDVPLAKEGNRYKVILIKEE